MRGTVWAGGVIVSREKHRGCDSHRERQPVWIGRERMDERRRRAREIYRWPGIGDGVHQPNGGFGSAATVWRSEAIGTRTGARHLRHSRVHEHQGSVDRRCVIVESNGDKGKSLQVCTNDLDDILDSVFGFWVSRHVISDLVFQKLSH